MTGSKKHRIVVVGAGLAGLTAAYRMQQAGYKVTVLESNTYPGGRAASTRKGGYLIDTGATGLGACYTEYLELVAELGLADKLVKASTISGTLRDGKIYEMDASRPLVTGALSKLFSWRSKFILPRVFKDMKAMGDKLCFEDVSKGHEWDDESAETYALRRLNPELNDYFVDPILRALVVGRSKYVSKLELLNSLDGLMGTEIMATRGGLETLPKGLAEVLDVQYQCTATRVRDEGDSVTVSYIDDTGAEHCLQADGCVLATLLPQAVEIYPECEFLVKPLSEELHYVPGICVHLGYAKQTRSKALMVLLSTREVPDITLIWLDHNKVDDRAPEGHSLFYFYYDDAVAGQAAGKSEADLIQQCSDLIEGLFPEIAGSRDMTNIVKWDAAVPLPATGIYKRMHQVRQNLDGHGGRVQLAGDYLSCVGQNTAVHYGNEAAKKLHGIVRQAVDGEEPAVQRVAGA
jgi:protoporphyrinogen/coproporphyrinogen III oxidase